MTAITPTTPTVAAIAAAPAAPDRLAAFLAESGEPSLGARLGSWLHNVAVLTRRNLIHIRREPAQMSDATVQPILFTLLFVTIFGSAMKIVGGSYKDFAIGGLIAMNLTTASMGTTVGLSSDLNTGVISRFRTLPMSRSAILTGRTIADLLSSALCGSIVMLTGLAIGWRPHHGLAGVLGALGVAVFFAFSLSWLLACLGLVSSDPESAQSVGLVALFPAAFVSSCFVPTAGMPAWMRTIANWNPISAVAGACRNLLGNPNPAAANHIWPAQHPVEAALLSSLVILAIAVPLSNYLLRRRTTD